MTNKNHIKLRDGKPIEAIIYSKRFRVEDKEITCTHCDSDYNTVSEYESRKITIRLKYKDKIKEIKVNPWELC
jgi:hypothetical protein